MALPQLKERQLALSAGLTGFKPQPRAPEDDRIETQGGWYDDPGENTISLQSLQTTAAFGVVSGVNRIRWDLVYIDNSGTVAVEAGVEQITPVADFTGAPGIAGPTTAPNMVPIAYVQVDEDVTVIVDEQDITDLRDWFGKYTRGVVGNLAADNSAGAPGVLGSIWSKLPADHQHPPNIGASTPADVDTSGEGPGAGFVYARTDHIHRLAPALVTAFRQPYDKAVTCLWAPYDNSGAGNALVREWVLHHFQGVADNDVTFYFNISRGIPERLTLFAIDLLGAAGNIFPGGSDDTNPLGAAVTNSFLYVYAIGVPGTTTYALVYSTNAPSTGPGLTNVAFTGPGYTAWRWVTCIEMSATSGLPVAARKVGNIVIKDWPTGTPSVGINTAGHAEDLSWVATIVPTIISLAEHISPMAMNVFIDWWVVNRTGGTTLQPAAAPGSVMGRMPRPDAGVFEPVKNIIQQDEPAGTVDKWNNDGFWMLVDQLRQIEVTVGIAGIGQAAGVVVAYHEHNLDDISNIDWSPP